MGITGPKPETLNQKPKFGLPGHGIAETLARSSSRSPGLVLVRLFSASGLRVEGLGLRVEGFRLSVTLGELERPLHFELLWPHGRPLAFADSGWVLLTLCAPGPQNSGTIGLHNPN